MRKKILIVIIIILAAVLAAAGILYFNKNKKNDEEKANTSATVVPWDLEMDEDEIPEKEEGKILIPGYEKMVMDANTKEQKVNMGNPSDNNCYFVIVLKLTDGTILFESDKLKPGEGLEEITINQELQKGEYQAVIEYHCYALEDESTLNGGSSEFSLIVQ